MANRKFEEETTVADAAPVKIRLTRKPEDAYSLKHEIHLDKSPVVDTPTYTWIKGSKFLIIGAYSSDGKLVKCKRGLRVEMKVSRILNEAGDAESLSPDGAYVSSAWYEKYYYFTPMEFHYSGHFKLEFFPQGVLSPGVLPCIQLINVYPPSNEVEKLILLKRCGEIELEGIDEYDIPEFAKESPKHENLIENDPMSHSESEGELSDSDEQQDYESDEDTSVMGLISDVLREKYSLQKFKESEAAMLVLSEMRFETWKVRYQQYMMANGYKAVVKNPDEYSSEVLAEKSESVVDKISRALSIYYNAPPNSREKPSYSHCMRILRRAALIPFSKDRVNRDTYIKLNNGIFRLALALIEVQGWQILVAQALYPIFKWLPRDRPPLFPGHNMTFGSYVRADYGRSKPLADISRLEELLDEAQTRNMMTTEQVKLSKIIEESKQWKERAENLRSVFYRRTGIHEQDETLTSTLEDVQGLCNETNDMLRIAQHIPVDMNLYNAVFWLRETVGRLLSIERQDALDEVGSMHDSMDESEIGNTPMR